MKAKSKLSGDMQQELALAWLLAGLERSGKKKIGLARALGVSPSEVTHICKGTRHIRDNELPLIANYIEVPVPNLLPSSGSKRSNEIAEDKFVTCELKAWGRPMRVRAADLDELARSLEKLES